MGTEKLFNLFSKVAPISGVVERRSIKIILAGGPTEREPFNLQKVSKS